MKLSKLIEILTDLDKRCKDKRPRLDIKTARIECKDELVITFSDKKTHNWKKV